jgi:UDP-3-O-[3-hydroxymyristoyl] glucosamine N-acyltransferase
MVGGTPAIPHKDWLRAASVYAKLPDLAHRLRELERRLAALEEERSP